VWPSSLLPALEHLLTVSRELARIEAAPGPLWTLAVPDRLTAAFERDARAGARAQAVALDDAGQKPAQVHARALFRLDPRVADASGRSMAFWVRPRGGERRARYAGQHGPERPSGHPVPRPEGPPPGGPGPARDRGRGAVRLRSHRYPGRPRPRPGDSGGHGRAAAHPRHVLSIRRDRARAPAALRRPGRAGQAGASCSSNRSSSRASTGPVPASSCLK
jgi:hypothetical protein